VAPLLLSAGCTLKSDANAVLKVKNTPLIIKINRPKLQPLLKLGLFSSLDQYSEI
jgi:hypothetical protein